MNRIKPGPSMLALALALLPAAPCLAQTPLGTAFTYQGQLTDAGSPANGSYDFQLILYDAASGGSQVGPIVSLDDLAVSAGLFTVAPDFGAVFGGARRFLEIGVRPGASGGAYTIVGPRQELTPGPSALFSSTAPWGGLSGVPAGFADGIDDDSGGDITSVTAGAGLAGGGVTGDLNLAVSFAGSGSATTASRSDHAHFGQSWTGASGSYGLQVVNSSSDGLVSRATATTGSSYGVDGQSASTSGTGVRGFATATSGSNFGVFGLTASPSGRGVFGVATAAAGTSYGVYGQSSSVTGTGVFGINTASSGQNHAVHGESASFYGRGVFGWATATGNGDAHGVRGRSDSADGSGVSGYATHTDGLNKGVMGVTDSSVGVGVFGVTTNGSPSAFPVAVWGWAQGGAGDAGVFDGNVQVYGTLSKSAGSFKIDHPLDPENKYLYHSFVESPDMLNVYNGNVVLDARGEAVIEMPAWFEALNRDFRYQLCALGAPGPGLHVADKVRDNRFRIAGGSPGLEVSWQVTGIRKDAFAEAHRIPVEQDKPERERGTYLHPSEHGMPKERSRTHQLLRLPDQTDGPRPLPPS
jgi:hypothetical protein